jgi:hypothetical protein
MGTPQGEIPGRHGDTTDGEGENDGNSLRDFRKTLERMRRINQEKVHDEEIPSLDRSILILG